MRMPTIRLKSQMLQQLRTNAALFAMFVRQEAIIIRARLPITLKQDALEQLDRDFQDRLKIMAALS